MISQALSLEPTAMLRLLQLASPALPIGAFAYSQGLEAAVAAGWVRDEAGAADWILGLLAGGVATLDLPVLARAHRAWSDGEPDVAIRWSAFLLAARASAELRAEERHLGRALARVLEGQGVAGVGALVTADAASYVALFAVGAAAFGVSAAAAQAGYAFAWTEAQVGAAMRLGTLGQAAGQRILGAAISAIPAAVAVAAAIDDDGVGAAAPAHAIVAAHHETQYSRLFRS